MHLLGILFIVFKPSLSLFSIHHINWSTCFLRYLTVYQSSHSFLYLLNRPTRCWPKRNQSKCNTAQTIQLGQFTWMATLMRCICCCCWYHLLLLLLWRECCMICQIPVCTCNTLVTFTPSERFRLLGNWMEHITCTSNDRRSPVPPAPKQLSRRQKQQ